MKKPKSDGSDPSSTPRTGERGVPCQNADSGLWEPEADFDYVKHDAEAVSRALSRGEIIDAVASHEMISDEIISYFLRNGFLKDALGSFPDPRKNWEVPMPVLLVPQLLQRLNDEHSLLLAPYYLNSAELITQLGYNVSTLEEGFNQRNETERKTPFHGETLKHVLNAADAEAMVNWFNKTLLPLWQAQAKISVGKSQGVKRQFIMDGMKIEVPAHLRRKYTGAGTVRNEDDTYNHGYKAVWIQQVLHPSPKSRPKNAASLSTSSEEEPVKRGILVALRIGPIEEHDLSLGRWVAQDFPFQKGDELIIDRGFIDSEWFNDLHEKHGVEIFIPLRRNMTISKETAILCATDRKEEWRPHPTRKDQWVQCLTEEDLKLWPECRVLKSGVIVKWQKSDQSFEEVVFVSTKPNQSPERLLATYDERPRIEETHRQLKLFQGIEKLPSKKWEHVVFRILMGVIAFNLLHLFLIDKKCETLETASTLKTLRQKRDRRREQNPQMIIYTEDAFWVIKLRQFHSLLLDIEDPVIRKRLKAVLAPDDS